jgi:hypothetical protein
MFVFKLIDGRALARSPDWSGNTGFALDFPFGTRKIRRDRRRRVQLGENDFSRDDERQTTGGRAQDIDGLVGLELDRAHPARGRESMCNRRFLTSRAT